MNHHRVVLEETEKEPQTEREVFADSGRIFTKSANPTSSEVFGILELVHDVPSNMNSSLKTTKKSSLEYENWENP